jgi:hypothetical protein
VVLEVIQPCAIQPTNNHIQLKPIPGSHTQMPVSTEVPTKRYVVQVYTKLQKPIHDPAAETCLCEHPKSLAGAAPALGVSVCNTILPAGTINLHPGLFEPAGVQQTGGKQQGFTHCMLRFK